MYKSVGWRGSSRWLSWMVKTLVVWSRGLKCFYSGSHSRVGGYLDRGFEGVPV